MERQRSHTSVFFCAFGVITGFTITVQGRGCRPEPAGMREAIMRYTTTRFETKTCGAARPLAPMSSSVSCMSAARLRISGAVGSATGSATFSRMGFPIFAMRRTLIRVSPEQHAVGRGARLVGAGVAELAQERAELLHLVARHLHADH